MNGSLTIFRTITISLKRIFYKYSALDTSLSFMADDILMTMASSGKSYFRLNKEVAKDGRDHYYIFRIKWQTPKC